VAKSGSICDIWLLELVLYTVELVPKPNKLGTGASSCSDAKLHIDNKITYQSTTGGLLQVRPGRSLGCVLRASARSSAVDRSSAMRSCICFCRWSRQLVVRTARRRPTRPPPYSHRSTRPPPQSHQSTHPPPVLGYSRLDLRVGEKGRIVEEDRWKGRRWGTGLTGAANSREDPGVRKERPFVLFSAGTHNTSVLAMATL
jgi:hypothetical protein